ncbi:basic proline-rich protein-like [Corvus cornix cornix]|uniref:basic proline-rich protein-like n=1 Tax=Corvus cornix cornix TaxID=932674 RepID=UPI00194E5FD9|nr:basic proline-rich protein-like [Corvus cornix cornix]
MPLLRPPAGKKGETRPGRAEAAARRRRGGTRCPQPPLPWGGGSGQSRPSVPSPQPGASTAAREGHSPVPPRPPEPRPPPGPRGGAAQPPRAGAEPGRRRPLPPALSAGPGRQRRPRDVGSSDGAALRRRKSVWPESQSGDGKRERCGALWELLPVGGCSQAGLGRPSRGTRDGRRGQPEAASGEGQVGLQE